MLPHEESLAEEYGVLALFVLELTSGLRKAEIVALLWTDLDVENKVLSVTKQATRVEGGESIQVRLLQLSAK